MTTLHVGHHVANPDRSLEHYENLGYDVSGAVPHTELGSQTMPQLQRDPSVSRELVHRPVCRDDLPGRSQPPRHSIGGPGSLIPTADGCRRAP